MTETPTPEWIFPGAKVILLVDNVDKRDNPTFTHATVDKLAKLSFTVTFTNHGREATERIYFKNLKSKEFGSSWHHWRYRVIEPTSPEVARLEAVASRVKTRDAARTAMRTLIEKHDNARMDDLTLLREAVVALTVHADVVLAQAQESE